MSDRAAGQEYIADGSRWLCYLVRADGVVCSEYVGPAIVGVVIDYTKTCAWRGQNRRTGYKRREFCDEYVVKGTHRCRTHQIR